jgi:hypothetical protein
LGYVGEDVEEQRVEGGFVDVHGEVSGGSESESGSECSGVCRYPHSEIRARSRMY